MAVALSTFAETQKPLEAPEETQTSTADTQTDTNTETSTTETTAQTQQSDGTVTTNTEEKKDNVSDFIIDLGEEQNENNPAQQATSGQPTFNFDEEIKKVDKKELLKKVGVTDFAIELDEHLSNGGKAEDYLNAKAIDYNQISDEDLVKDSIRKQYVAAGQKISQRQVDILFERKYALSDDATEDDKELLDLQLKTDANNLRQQKIAEQQKFKINHVPVLHTDEAYEQWKQIQESQPKLIEEAKNYFLNHEATKTLNDSKRVTVNLGESVPPFNFNVDKPEMITQVLTDGGQSWKKLTSTKTGEPDVPKQQLLTVFAANPQKFMQDIFNYGVSAGQRKLVSEGQNATKPTTPVHSITGEKATYKTGTYSGQ
jgi:hypothetical protein